MHPGQRLRASLGALLQPALPDLRRLRKSAQTAVFDGQRTRHAARSRCINIIRRRGPVEEGHDCAQTCRGERCGRVQSQSRTWRSQKRATPRSCQARRSPASFTTRVRVALDVYHDGDNVVLPPLWSQANITIWETRQPQTLCENPRCCTAVCGEMRMSHLRQHLGPIASSIRPQQQRASAASQVRPRPRRRQHTHKWIYAKPAHVFEPCKSGTTTRTQQHRTSLGATPTLAGRGGPRPSFESNTARKTGFRCYARVGWPSTTLVTALKTPLFKFRRADLHEIGVSLYSYSRMQRIARYDLC